MHDATMLLQTAWARRFWADLTKKEFVAIKLLFFLIHGASMAMFPFLTLQARALGISERELGVVYAVIPVVALLGPPTTGILADKIGNFKVYLSLTMALSGMAGLLFLAVPVGRESLALPDALPFTVTCGSGGAALHLQEPHLCRFTPGLASFTVNVTSCSECTFDSAPGSQIQVVTTPCPTGEGGELGCPGQLPPGVSPQLVATGDASGLRVVNWTCPSTAGQTAYEVESLRGAPGECVVACGGVGRREGVCTNANTRLEYRPATTFWLYMLVRVLNSLTLATSFTLFDGATMAILKQHKGDYGFQRLYGNLGAIVVTPLSGFLIDHFSELNHGQDYRPAFYLYCAMKLVGAVAILFVSLDFRDASSTVIRDVKILIRKPEILVFVLVMMIAGACFGLLDTFLFWLLQDLGATKSLMGVTVTVGSAAGIVTLLASGYLIKRLGHVNTIILGFAFYVIRMIGYSILENPWWCMPFEALECFTVSLMSAAGVAYAADLATPSTLATLQGMYGGIHYGVGRGVGSLLGGFLIGPLGLRNTFRLMALICGVTCIAYFIVNHVFFRKHQAHRKQEMEAKKKKEGEEARKNEDEEGRKKGGGDEKNAGLSLREDKSGEVEGVRVEMGNGVVGNVEVVK